MCKLFDGRAKLNPGYAGCGWVVRLGAQTLAEGYLYLGSPKNNEAEYKGLLNGLLAARNCRIATIKIQGDSWLVIK